MRSLIIENLSHTWQDRSGEVPALREINLELPFGVPVFFCGTSGAGKSTLGMLIAGLLRPQSGKIQVMPETERIESAFVFQFPEHLFIEDTVQREADSVIGKSVHTVEQWFSGFDLDFPRLRDQSPHTLSAAEGRMTAIALQLARDPDVLILDEPTLGLDSRHRRRLGEVLRNWIKPERLLLAITHDLQLIKSIGGSVCILEQGRVGWIGESEVLLSNKKLLTHYELI